jgi:hypothetical protein
LGVSGFCCSGCFFGAFRVLWVLLGCSAVFGLVLGLWVCKCSLYTACVLGRLSVFNKIAYLSKKIFHFLFIASTALKQSLNLS